jgi:hypothetical protein
LAFVLNCSLWSQMQKTTSQLVWILQWNEFIILIRAEQHVNILWINAINRCLTIDGHNCWSENHRLLIIDCVEQTSDFQLPTSSDYRLWQTIGSLSSVRYWLTNSSRCFFNSVYFLFCFDCLLLTVSIVSASDVFVGLLLAVPSYIVFCTCCERCVLCTEVGTRYFFRNLLPLVRYLEIVLPLRAGPQL